MSESGAEVRVDVRGGSMTVHRRPGPGPTLLFLHYWGGSAKTWDAVINALPERDTVAITQRGWGESARLGGPYGLQQFADDVETIIDRLDLSEVVPVGHSMGGKVAQIMAGRGTPTLTRLILVAPAPPVPPQHITSKYRQQLSHACDNAESIRYARDHILTHQQLPDDLAAQELADSAASADDAARLYWPVQDRPWSCSAPITVLRSALPPGGGALRAGMRAAEVSARGPTRADAVGPWGRQDGWVARVHGGYMRGQRKDQRKVNRIEARTRSPSARHAAATPIAQPAPPLGRASTTFRVGGALLRHPGPLRSLTSTRTVPPPVITAAVTVSPGSPDLLYRKAHSSAGQRHPRRGGPGRAPRPRTRGRPAPAPPARQPSRSPEPAPQSSDTTPSRPPALPERPQARGRTQGCTLDSAVYVKPERAASAARP